MPIFYPDILEERSAPQSFAYSDKDVILYALGIGMGADPMNQDELPFVFEKDLHVMPTAVTVLHAAAGRPVMCGPTSAHRLSSVNHAMVLHAEQKVELHRPIPASGMFTCATRTVAALDKGSAKGAIIRNETEWTDANGGKVATLTSSILARGDGGFGGPSSDHTPLPSPPERRADRSAEFETAPGLALLYRLTGDRNPLHADPDAARLAGFDRPILHGMCTFGITCRAILQEIVGFDADRILSHQARFSAPVIPGETIVVDLWCGGDLVWFTARSKERGVTVIKNGLTRLRPQ